MKRRSQYNPGLKSVKKKTKKNLIFCLTLSDNIYTMNTR